MLETASTPGQIIDLPYEWGKFFDADMMEKDKKEMMEEEGIPSQEWGPSK
jgi:hypothetical protein